MSKAKSSWVWKYFKEETGNAVCCIKKEGDGEEGQGGAVCGLKLKWQSNDPTTHLCPIPPPRPAACRPSSSSSGAWRETLLKPSCSWASTTV